MNIYMIQEDGESMCWQAENMQDALTAATNYFARENWDWLEKEEETPTEYYQRCILQGCTLIGELGNPVQAHPKKA